MEFLHYSEEMLIKHGNWIKNIEIFNFHFKCGEKNAKKCTNFT